MTLLGERSMNGHRPRHDRVGKIDWPLAIHYNTFVMQQEKSSMCGIDLQRGAAIMFSGDCS